MLHADRDGLSCGRELCLRQEGTAEVGRNRRLAHAVQARLTTMKHKRLLVNLGVLTLSAGCGVLLCEVASRALLHPADYLAGQMVPDPLLGAVPSTRTKAGGFDAWGFR